MKRKLAVITAFGVLASISGTALAQAKAPVDKRWYGGLEFGRGKAHLDGGDIDRAHANQGLTSSGTSIDRGDQAWGLKLGYRFDPNWAIEGGWSSLGKYGYTSTITAPGAGTVTGDYEASAWSLAGVGTLPLNPKWGVYGKLGVAWTRAELGASAQGGGINATGRDSSRTGALIGVGTSYDFTPEWFGRLGWDRYTRVGNDNETGRSEIDVIGLGIGRRF